MTAWKGMRQTGQKTNQDDGMNRNGQSIEQPCLWHHLMAGMLMAMAALAPAVVQAQSAEAAFEPEQRSTLENIPFRASEKMPWRKRVSRVAWKRRQGGGRLRPGKVMDSSWTPWRFRPGVR